MVYFSTVERGDNKIKVLTFWKMRDPGDAIAGISEGDGKLL